MLSRDFARPGRCGPAVAAVLALAATVGPRPAAAEPFVAHELAKGVHLFRPAEGSRTRTNSLVVEQRDGLVVIEAQPSPDAARELLAAIGKRFDRPVRYLVYSHPHAESAGGASGFPSSTVVFASRESAESLKDEAFDFGAESRILADDPEAWVAPERRIPDVAVFARATLDDPERPVELMPIGQAHSRGDVVIRVPSAEVMYVGSLVFPESDPYAKDANIGSWLAGLNNLIRQSPRLIVGLRGEPITSAQVRKQRDALAWLRGQVGSIFIDRPPVEAIHGMVLESEGIDEYLDVDEPFRTILIDRAIDEAYEKRKKFGLE